MVEVPVLLVVAPVNIIRWLLWALVMVILTTAVPFAVMVEVGEAPVSVLLNERLTVSLPVFMLLLYWSCACMLTLKAAPAVCGELIFDTR